MPLKRLSEGEARDARDARRLVLLLLAVQLAVACAGGFRADDWTNLERGAWSWTAAGRLGIWTSLNPFTLYRPLVDLWHGLMLRCFGLDARPMLAVLALLLLLESWLLARFVRARGGGRSAAAFAAAAVWAQPNTYAWTTLWVSNATGALMALGALLALLLYERSVRHLQHAPRSAALSLLFMSLAFLAGALCKEEIVLLPGVILALEWPLWRERAASERRARLSAWLALTAVTAAYTFFRTHVVPTPQVSGTRYNLHMGGHVLHNMQFFALHLGVMPVVALALVWWLYPPARPAAARTSEAWRRARAGLLGGLGWAIAALLLYLPISGRPAYGYLFVPAFGIAYAVAHGLAFAVETARRAGPTRAGTIPLLLHAALAVTLTGVGLLGIAWPRYRALAGEATATLRHDWPRPPLHAHVLFLDPPAHETFAGRTLFNLLLDDASGAFLRLTYERPDLDATVVHAPTPAAADLRPNTIAIYRAERGRLTRVPLP